MNDDPSPQAAPNVETAYAAALDAAMNAPTPQARAKAVDEMEALAKQQVAVSGDPAVSHGEPQEGYEAPESGLAYQFEQNLPPGVEIVDREALGALKSGLAAAGVPAEIGNAAFGDVARLTGEGAFASEATYIEACGICRAQLESVHGEEAKTLIADALAWIEDAVRANPKLEDAATMALASPLAIQAAANMRRHGGGRKG
jgi:hypothetical protein